MQLSTRLDTSGSPMTPQVGLQDDTLIGMVAKGHGIEALCLFLDVLQVDLLARVVALDLYTPTTAPFAERTGFAMPGKSERSDSS